MNKDERSFILFLLEFPPVFNYYKQVTDRHEHIAVDIDFDIDWRTDMSNYGTFGENNPVWKAISRFADMMVTGILFIITCIPIITIGASLCAFYFTAMDVLRKEDGYIFKRYFTNFAKNFKKGTLLWLIMLALAAICGLNLVCWMMNGQMKIALPMLVISGILSVIWMMTFVFVFPLQARFENPVGKTIENAFLLSISRLPFTISTIVLLGGLAYLCSVSWLALLAMLLFGVGVVGYLLVYNFERLFKKCGYIDEDDGKVKNDDYDFDIEVDYDEIYNRETDLGEEEASINEVPSESERETEPESQNEESEE